MFGVMCFAEEKIPQAEFLCLDLKFFNYWNDCLPSLDGISRQLSLSQG